MAPIGTRIRNCFSRVRRSAGVSIPGQDTDCTVCRAVYLFVHCALFIALLNLFHYSSITFTNYYIKSMYH